MLRLNDFFNAITGNNIDKKNDQGQTRLYLAAREGNTAAVKKLLRAGADPDIADARGLTPLHQAAYWGESDIVGLLLKSGASPNADNGKGWTPLHSAAMAGGMKSRKSVIEKLKAAGGKDDIADQCGWTARDYMALWAENADAATKLKQRTDMHAPHTQDADRKDVDLPPVSPPPRTAKRAAPPPQPPQAH